MVRLEISELDFDYLMCQGGEWNWKTLDRHIQEGRFTVPDHKPIERDYPYAYWMPDYSSVVMAKCFLKSIEQPFQLLFDHAENQPPFLITTTFGSIVMRGFLDRKVDNVITFPGRRGYDG